MGDEIVWINHAGYELRSNGVRLVHDPWTKGLAFADGWALISESRYTSADFAGVDYIWFSHEHPDHFPPAALREIPEEIRRQITVLFQKTGDRRVVDFCRKLGFGVQELPNAKRVSLKNDIFVTCGTAVSDSWLMIETPENTYFNANDVVGVDWPSLAARLGRPIDVLFTQFSYAQWVGNPGETAKMAASAIRKLDEMDAQIGAFDPRILVPFASFVWFCREENFHLNAGANRIDKIFTRYKDRVETVVLYPGDHYRVGEPFPSRTSVERYLADWERHDRPLAIIDPTISLPELIKLSRQHQDRLRVTNALWILKPLGMLNYFAPVSIYLSDLEAGISYSMMGGILSTNVKRHDCDIEFLSSSFKNMLCNGYGYNTLSINGRFRDLTPGASLRLSRHFAVAAQNEQGYGVPGIFLRREYVVAHARRFIAAIGKRIARGLPF